MGLDHTLRACSEFREFNPRVFERSRFKSSPGLALQELEVEGQRLGARGLVVELDIADRDVRNDGKLRANATPRSPQVRATLSMPDGESLRFHADKYDRWWDNIVAIAKTIQALRGIDRWGAVQDGQQYEGFKALPPGSGESSSRTAWECIVALAEAAGHDADAGRKYAERYTALMRSREQNKGATFLPVLDVMYRTARQSSHPDINRGNDEQFVQLGKDLEIWRPPLAEIADAGLRTGRA